MKDISRLGVTGLRELYAKREVTPVEVVDHLLAVIGTRDGEVRAYLGVFGDSLRAEADAMTKGGDFTSLPLGGVPVALKDNICTAGTRTSCGSKILEHYRSPYDATVVERLRSAGALIIGKTNLDEFAMGSSTENSAFGPVFNPWNTAYSPGGSSGGSAAAVAADIAFAALGSDTGGSIRQPASFCGVVGMKPTYGRVSRYGLVAFASSLDQIGPFTKNVRDSALLLGVISGRDRRDSTSMETPVPDFARDRDRGLEGLTVGVPRAFIGDNVSSDVKKNFDDVLKKIEAAGATLCDIDLRHAEHGVAAYYVIANAEASANLARFDGVKYGHRTSSPSNLLEMYTATRDEGFGAEVKRRILLGTYVLSSGYYDAYYDKAQRVRSLIIRDYNDAFERCDLIISPTAPTAAFRIGEKVDDPILMYASDVFTIPVNLAGLPGISVPTGLSEDRLPLGVQLTAKPLDEVTLFRGAAGIESVVAFEEHAIA